MAFRQAVALSPKDVKYHQTLGNALSDNGDIEAAIGHYQRAIHLDPDDFKPHMNLCIGLMKKQASDGAIAAAREAIRCKPDLAQAHCNPGRALQQKGLLREALESLQRGHELGGKDPNWKYPSAQWVEECQQLLKESEAAKAPNMPPPTVEPAPAPAGKEGETSDKEN